MSSSGFMQHPDVEGMSADDYDAFIASPYDCLLETILPRLYPELDAPPAQRALVFAKAMRAYQDETNTLVQMKAKMTAKYGYSTIPAGQSSAMTEAPYDFSRLSTGFPGYFQRYPEKAGEGHRRLRSGDPAADKKGCHRFSTWLTARPLSPAHGPLHAGKGF